MKFQVAFGYKIYELTPDQRTTWDKTNELALVPQTKTRLELLVKWRLDTTGIRDVDRSIAIHNKEG